MSSQGLMGLYSIRQIYIDFGYHILDPVPLICLPPQVSKYFVAAEKAINILRNMLNIMQRDR